MNTKSEFSWENLWRKSGNNFILTAIISYFLYGFQPRPGTSGEELIAFYDSHHLRILIAAFVSGMTVLNLLWFAATLRATHAEEGRDGWGAAVIISSSITGGLFILLVTVSAALAYSISGSGNPTLISGLNDLLWAGFVMTSFPRAMFIMSGSFGLWRAGLISNAWFGVCVAALVLVLLGGTTWMKEGFWSPDGIYSRFVSPIIGVVWVACINKVLMRSPATNRTW